jgi:hypothetical protein
VTQEREPHGQLRKLAHGDHFFPPLPASSLDSWVLSLLYSDFRCTCAVGTRNIENGRVPSGRGSSLVLDSFVQIVACLIVVGRLASCAAILLLLLPFYSMSTLNIKVCWFVNTTQRLSSLSLKSTCTCTYLLFTTFVFVFIFALVEILILSGNCTQS